MTLRDWASLSADEIRKHGVGGVKWSYSKLMAGLLRQIGTRYNYGMDPMGEDWEVLILLDSCRPDLLRSVCEEEPYDWVPPVETRYSPASTSREWVDKTIARLSNEDAAEMGIVSANGFTISHIDTDRFHTVLNLAGRDDYWIEGEGLDDRAITDHAIRLWRSDDRPNRMIVWYHNPHTPLPNTDLSPEFYDEYSESDLARRGELSRETFVEGHKQNIRTVLTEVKSLLENLDSDSVVISADHAELFGEYGLYGHPHYVPVPLLKRVPWIRVDGTDTHSRDPDVELPEFNESDLEDQLTALGYR